MAVEGHAERPGADHPPQGAEGLAAGDADLPLVPRGGAPRGECYSLQRRAVRGRAGEAVGPCCRPLAPDAFLWRGAGQRDVRHAHRGVQQRGAGEGGVAVARGYV